MNKLAIVTERRIILKMLKYYFENSNMTLVELSNLTGFKISSLERLFSGKYSPSLDQLIVLQNHLYPITHYCIVI